MSSLSGFRRRICTEQTIVRPKVKERRRFRIVAAERRLSGPEAIRRIREEGRQR